MQKRCNKQQIYKSYNAINIQQTTTSTSCTFKNVNHVMNCCIFQLFSDIEKNPGPTQIDPSKTICAPYSQGNVDVFGSYAGRQCVAMSLCALIYNSNKQITESQDLIQIMNIGNELYGALSRLTGQSYLLLTELPTMVAISNTNYQLEFSECYSSYLHSSAFNENIPSVMPLNCALHSLIQDGYNSFLLTIASNTVAVYINPSGVFKVFDSHARDLFGVADACGTCTLLEVSSVINLVEYFRNIYNLPVLFELRGIKICCAMHIDTYPLSSNLQTDNKNHTPDDNKIDFAQFSAVLCFYSVFFYYYIMYILEKSHTTCYCRTCHTYLRESF